MVRIIADREADGSLAGSLDGFRSRPLRRHTRAGNLQPERYESVHAGMNA